MAVTVPSTDPVNYALQANVTQLQALVTANANPAVQPQLIQQLDEAQQLLVMSLMGTGGNRLPGTGNATSKPSFLTASGILAAGTINT